MEEITAALSKIRWLFVIARNSSFTYKGKLVDVRQVGYELGVRYVLEGSVRKAGQQVRISVQLIDADNGNHLWTDTFNGSMECIFELQDCVASCVAGEIEPQLRQTEIVRARRKQPNDLGIYDLYLHALGERHKHTEDGIRAALVHLERVLELDPSYVPAATLICECRMVLKLNACRAVSDAEIADGIRLARYVIQQGTDDSNALSIGAIFLSIYAHDHVVAADAVERALLLNPSSALAWSIKGWISCHYSRPYEAAAAFERALCLSPLDPIRGYFRAGLALANLLAGKCEEALEWAEHAANELPNYAAPIHT